MLLNLEQIKDKNYIPTTINEVRQICFKNGCLFFTSFNFFHTKIESDLIEGKFFITSDYIEDEKYKKYYIRYFDRKIRKMRGNIEVLAVKYENLEQAINNLKNLLNLEDFK